MNEWMHGKSNIKNRNIIFIIHLFTHTHNVTHPNWHSISPFWIEMKEALVVCGSRNLTVGVTIWDIETGNHILHIPTCASPFHGITCLKHQYLIASQIQIPGSVAAGVIFTWPFSKVYIYTNPTRLYFFFYH